MSDSRRSGSLGEFLDARNDQQDDILLETLPGDPWRAGPDLQMQWRTQPATALAAAALVIFGRAAALLAKR